MPISKNHKFVRDVRSQRQPFFNPHAVAAERREAEERERAANEQWLNSPAGKAHTEARFAAESRAKREAKVCAEETARHEIWLKSPEGVASTEAKAKERQDQTAALVEAREKNARRRASIEAGKKRAAEAAKKR
jgi:hypothetical protein